MNLLRRTLQSNSFHQVRKVTTIRNIFFPQFKPISSLRYTSSTTAVNGQSFEFQAETEKLLDIVTNSIYTEKEVFLRELISNSSDALEKARFLNPEGKYEIAISLDKEKKTLGIKDSGIGMSKEEMIKNLGTIAKSGSKEFMSSLENNDVKDKIIGQFGVGFYSAFMVASKIEVYSKQKEGGEYKWTSTGSGSFTIEDMSENSSGEESYTRIVLYLKEDSSSLGFLEENKVKDTVKSYSKFVSFPVLVNNDIVNTVDALWTKNKSEIKKEDYKEFYQYLTNMWDEPLYTTHFTADAPIDVKCILFVPTMNMEKSPMAGRYTKGVSLYSRKVLVESNSERILPNWLRFLKGVVDSEDLPISLSRESVQNSRLVANLQELLVKRFLKQLKAETKKDNDNYCQKFWPDFGSYLLEGVCSQEGMKYKTQTSPLLRFHSSYDFENKNLVSLDEYVSRTKPEQDKIYYLNVGNLRLALSSPYYEAFKDKGIEVLFISTPLEEFSLNALGVHNDKEIVSISSVKDLNLQENDVDQTKFVDLKTLFKLKLEGKVNEIEVSQRLKSSPAIVVDAENISSRRLMKQLSVASDGNLGLSGVLVDKLEINVENPLIKKIEELRQSSEKEDEELVDALITQVYDSAMINSGILDDAREMLPRLNLLLEKLVTRTN
eukprot:snap_masked-scaffold_43-processed-gene-1.66-mRNA-1 protein AED:0.01 eAED:0.01 QI:0/-1/0/1/-1/1/1/0/661